jgi:hypothetical protein
MQLARTCEEVSPYTTTRGFDNERSIVLPHGDGASCYPVHEAEDEMNGYVCFWNRQRCEVYAESTLKAQEKATAEFQKGTRKKVKSYEVTAMLAEKDGKEVTHLPLM